MDNWHGEAGAIIPNPSGRGNSTGSTCGFTKRSLLQVSSDCILYSTIQKVYEMSQKEQYIVKGQLWMRGEKKRSREDEVFVLKEKNKPHTNEREIKKKTKWKIN